MKAVIIKNDGFRKYMNIDKRVPLISTLGLSSVNLYPLEEYGSQDVEIPITTYEFVREYVDEFDQEMLIYRETP